MDALEQHSWVLKPLGNGVAHSLAIALGRPQGGQMIVPLSTVESAKEAAVLDSVFGTSCRTHSSCLHNEYQRTSGGAQLLERRTVILSGGITQGERRLTCLGA